MPGYLSNQLRVFTDDSHGAALALSAYAQLVGPIKLQPQVLAWGMPDPDHWSDDDSDVILSRQLIVTVAQPDRPLTISKLTSTVKDLSLTLEAVEENRQYMIEATLPHRLKEPVRGTISFETNLPELPKVEVPVEVNIWRND